MAAISPAAVTPAIDERARARLAWFGFIAMLVGNFMAILDIQIVASSINQLQAGLSASADEIQWVQSSYLIAEVIAIPLSGYLSRLLSTRIYFTICTLGFTLASVACATAWNLESMIVFRVIQGFLGGGMIPTTSASMYLMFPPAKRILPQVLFGLIATLAPSVGPTIGGWLTESVSWHWMFLINVLPGFAVAYAVWHLVKIDRPQPELLKVIDLRGLLFMAVFLGCFEYTLDEGPRNDWFSQDSIAICAVMAVLAGMLFFHRMFTAEHPVVDLRAFADRNFALGTVLAMAVGMSLYTLIYLTPLFLGQVRGYNSLQIGHVMIAQGVAMFLTAPIAGRLSKILSLKTMLAIGICSVSIGAWLNSRLTADWSVVEFIVPQIFRGSGLLLCMFSMTSMALGTLPMSEVKNASGLFNVMRNIGGAIGLALINTLINERSWLHWQMLSESVRGSHPPVREMLAAGQTITGSEAGAMSLLMRQMQQQVAVMTYGDMFALVSMMMASVLLVLPLIRSPRTQPGNDPGTEAATSGH